MKNNKYKKMDTLALLKTRRSTIILAFFMCFFLILLIFVTIMSAYELSCPPEFSYDDDNSFFAMLIFVGLGGLIFFFFAFLNNVIKIIDINRVLAKRPDLKEIKAVYKSNFKNNVKIYVIAAVIIIIIIMIGRSCSIGGGSGSGCTICSKNATHTFQGSQYCTEHYNDAVKWAIDNVKDNA